MRVLTGFFCLAIGSLLVLSCSSTDSTPRERNGTANNGQGGSSGGGGSTPGGGGSAGGGTAGIGLSGGATGPVDNSCGAVEQEPEQGLQPADIIMAIDNSGSMTETAQAVQDNMNTFVNSLATTGIDVHVILISTTSPQVASMYMAPPPDGGAQCDPYYCPGGTPPPMNQACQGNNGVCIGTPFGSGNCPDDTKLPNFLHILDCVNSWDGLNLMVQDYPKYKDSLRPQASKTFVLVTDDDSIMGNYTPDEFDAAVKALDPSFANYKFDGILNFDDCHKLAHTSTTGIALVKLKQGISANICTVGGMGSAAFEPVFKDLSTGVIQSTHIACDWAIPPAPDGQTFDANKVNVHYTPGNGQPVEILKVAPGAQCGQDGGWTYDNESAPTRVVACPATCDQLQADTSGKVSLAFGCATKILPVH